MCHILGPGLNTHLTENELLRDIFQLGDKLIIKELPINKQTKLEKVCKIETAILNFQCLFNSCQ